MVMSRQTAEQVVDGLQYCLNAIRALDPPLKVEDIDYLNDLADLVAELKHELQVQE